MQQLLVLFVIALCMPVNLTFAQGLHAKIEARRKATEKPKQLDGESIKVQLAKPFDQVYEQVINWANQENYTIDPENTRKDIGTIVTTVAQTSGGYTQTGRRIRIVVIKVDESSTTLKIAVEDLKRKKLFAAEAWSDGKLNEEESQSIADKIGAKFATTLAESK